MKENKSRLWLRLDNAAKIFPASMRRGWSNVFRLSVSFKDPVDPVALERAVKRVARRFPSVCVCLKKGFFWYYLEEGNRPPRVRPDAAYPLVSMTKREMKRGALRILYYENRMAVEFFHALTDGTGAMVFIKTLAAAYLEETKGISIPKEDGVLSLDEGWDKEELEDAFLRYAGPAVAPRDTSHAFCLGGEKEPDGFLHLTCASIPTANVIALAREKGVSITTLLSACLTQALVQIQREKLSPGKQRAVRIQIPVNLRRFFPSRTLRNFVAVVNVGLEKEELDATFDETLSQIHHQMALFVTKRNLRAIFSANVKSEEGMAIRLVPLFLKNIVMRAVFDAVGESGACLCLSNLGQVKIPWAMAGEVERFDFIIGPQAKAPYNCGVLSYGDTLRINLIRNTRQPELERVFFPLLSSLGLPVTLESNER